MTVIKKNNIKFRKNELSKLENKLNVSLPDEYVKFLREYNGGTLESNIFRLEASEIENISVSEFFGTGLEDYNDLIEQYKLYSKRLPSDYIPIARAEGGNIICINIKNQKIFLWDHDSELIEEEHLKDSSLILIANSFSHFLNNIEEYDFEEELEGYEVEEVWIDPDFLEELKKYQ
jgi:hypothetical protein